MPINKIRQIEVSEGKSIRIILQEKFALLGSQRKVAQALGVTQSTISTWITRLGLQQWATLIPRKQEPQK